MTRIPDPGFPIKTGPLKIGADWCGVFIRGDAAAAFADALRPVAERSSDILARVYARRLIEMVEASRETEK